jgi:probable HAF family extracellular repeat protein
MRRQPTLVLIAVAALLTDASLSLGEMYAITDLGTLQSGGLGKSLARYVNNSGQIVGRTDPTGQGLTQQAILFDPTGTGHNVDLGTLGGSNDPAYAAAISDTGVIVGYVYSPGGEDRATLFDPTGGGHNIDLGTIDNSPYSSAANAANSQGQIVGWAKDASGVDHATVFDSTGAGNNLSLHGPPANSTKANAINNLGQIVGSSEYWIPGDAVTRATMFDTSGAGNNIDLGTLGGSYSNAFSINDAGMIVGQAATTSNQGHATLFDPTGAGNNIDLGTLGGLQSAAFNVNNHGQIVGWSWTGAGSTFRATLFDDTGGWNNIDLNTCISSPGWLLEYAFCMNDYGLIVGMGINPLGYEHAFLLTPTGQPNIVPVPGAALLGTIGLLYSGWRLRRRTA